MAEEVCFNIWSLLYICFCNLNLVFELLIHNFIVNLLIMNNNIAICNHHDIVSMM